jgi:hypothetical protein
MNLENNHKAQAYFATIGVDVGGALRGSIWLGMIEEQPRGGRNGGSEGSFEMKRNE